MLLVKGDIEVYSYFFYVRRMFRLSRRYGFAMMYYIIIRYHNFANNDDVQANYGAQYYVWNKHLMKINLLGLQLFD